MENIFESAKWIWAKNNAIRGDVVYFRKVFDIAKPPKTAVAFVAAQSRYFLSVNGKSVVTDGGMNGCYDEIDIARYLVKGSNVVSAVAVFDGERGTNIKSADCAGFIFCCKAVDVYSDSCFTVFPNGAFTKSEDVVSSGHRAGTNIRYDATLENAVDGYEKAEFGSGAFTAATEYGEYGAAPWGELKKRPIPFFVGEFVPKVKKIERRFDKFSGDRYADVYTAALPRAMYVYPYFSVTATAGDKIEIKTDRFDGRGGYGDEGTAYDGFKLEYICKEGTQQFMSLQCLFGEKLIVSVSPSVKVSAKGYRESAYDGEQVGYFETDNEFFEEKLLDKCANTLACCMRGNFTDAPERGEFLSPASASAGARSASYIFDRNAVLLTEKAMRAFIDNAENDVIFFDPEGERKEKSVHALIALSQYGIGADYFAKNENPELLREWSLAGLKYLAKWDIGADGFVVCRGLKNGDGLFNADDKIILNALYLSALKCIKSLSEKAGDELQSDFLNDRTEQVAAAIKGCFDGTGYTTREGFYDDRANALALLSLGEYGETAENKSIAKILSSVGNATPLFEGFVLQALCEAGRGDAAFDRMCSRHYNAAMNDSSVMPEDFNGLGARCYLGAVAPLYIAFEYFAGVKIDCGGKEITVTPDLRRLKNIRFACLAGEGKLVGKYFDNGGKTEILIENTTGTEVTLVLKRDFVCADIGSDERVVKLSKGKNKFTL